MSLMVFFNVMVSLKIRLIRDVLHMCCDITMCTKLNIKVRLFTNARYKPIQYLTQYTDSSRPLYKTSHCQGLQYVRVGGLPPSLHIRGPKIIIIVLKT